MATADFPVVMTGGVVTSADSKKWLTYYKLFWSAYQWTTNGDTTRPTHKIRVKQDMNVSYRTLTGKKISDYQSRQRETYEAVDWRFGSTWAIQNGATRPTLLDKKNLLWGDPLSTQSKGIRINKSLGGKLYYEGYTYNEMYAFRNTTRSYFDPVFDMVQVPKFQEWDGANVVGKWTEELFPLTYRMNGSDGFILEFQDPILEAGTIWDAVHHNVGTLVGGFPEYAPPYIETTSVTVQAHGDHYPGKSLVNMTFGTTAPDGSFVEWDSIIDKGETAGRLWGALIDTPTLIEEANKSGVVIYEDELVFNPGATIYEVDYDYGSATYNDTTANPDLVLSFVFSGVTDPTEPNGIRIGSEYGHTVGFDEEHATDVNYYYYATSADDDEIPFEPLYDKLLTVKLPNSMCHIVVYKDYVSAVKVRVGDSETMYVSLVELEHVKASPIRVMTPQGVKALHMLETQDQV